MERNNLYEFYSEYTPMSIDWLWYPYIPYSKITIVQGDPGEGKTTLVLQLAAALSKGAPFFTRTKQTSPINIIYQNAEDGVADTIVPRLIAAGADRSRIAFIKESDAPLSMTDPRLEKAINSLRAKLLILDPMQAYLGADADITRANSVREKMKHLTDIAARTGCAIVLVGHMNKSSSSKGLYRGLGSIDITAAARSVLLVGRTQSDSSIRAVAHLKSSLAPEGPTVAFELDADCGFRWIGEYEISVEELLSGDSSFENRSKLGIALNLLSSFNPDQEIPCEKIMELCISHHIGKRTLYVAKKELGIRSIKKGERWYWVVPQHANKQEKTEDIYD